MVDTVGTVYPFARLSEANKTIITSAVKRTGPIGGVCRVIHIVGSSDGDDFTNIRTGNFPLFGNGSERLFTKSK